METRIQPVILSGGAGTRLWPLSRAEKPKQFLALEGERTILQATLDRIIGIEPFLPPLFIANARHEEELRAQAGEAGAEGVRLLLEPIGRNTAPAIAAAALTCEPETLLLVMPSDQSIRDAESFRATVAAGARLADQDYLVTFGIVPDAPETGYGYICTGAALTPTGFTVTRFVEKPDITTAAAYCEAGYLWNAGIFLFKAGSLLSAMEDHAPGILASCREAVASGKASVDALHLDATAFARAPSISIDYAVMEKADRVAVVPLDVGWSDIGSWDALCEHAKATPRPEVIEIDTKGCFVRTDGPVVAAVGVEDLIIVATKDAVLVLPRGQSQRVKEVIARLPKANCP